MDMETFVRECRSCDVSADKEKASELLAFAAQLGEAILSAREKQGGKIPYDRITELYNEICVSLPKVCKLSPERRRHLKVLFDHKYTVGDFEKVFRTVQSTPFLRGENERGWRAAFDWIIKPANFLKVLENNYGRAEKSKPSYDTDALWEHAMKQYD